MKRVCNAGVFAKGILAFCCLVFATMAQSKDFSIKGKEGFYCKYESRDTGGWMPYDGFYWIFPEQKKMVILDGPVMAANNDRAMLIDMQQPNPGVYVARWSLELRASGNSTLTAFYRIRLDERKGRAQMSGTLSSADNEPRTYGKCTKEKLK